MALTRDEVVQELAANAAKATEAQTRLDGLRSYRLDLFHAGKALDPPLTNRELAEAAGVTEWNVMKVLRKDKDAKAKDAS